MAASSKPLVFVSYSHKDEDDEPEKWLSYVRSHLKTAETGEEIVAWDDFKIDGGEDWRRRIETALTACCVFVFLVSRHSLVSEFIREEETKKALERAHAGGVHIYPIFLSDLHVPKDHWLHAFNWRPRNGQPLEALAKHERNKAMKEIVGEIAAIAARPRTAPEPGKGEAHAGDPAAPTGAQSWLQLQNSAWRADFATLTIHAAPDAGAHFPLKVTTSFSAIDLKIPATATTPAARAKISVKAADLLPVFTGAEMVTGTVAGRDRKPAPVAFDTTFKFKLKKGQNAPPLLEEPLCDVQANGHGPHAVELVMRCKDTDLHVEWLQKFDDIDRAQEVMLERLLQLMQIGEDGVILELARATAVPEPSE